MQPPLKSRVDRQSDYITITLSHIYVLGVLIVSNFINQSLRNVCLPVICLSFSRSPIICLHIICLPVIFIAVVSQSVSDRRCSKRVRQSSRGEEQGRHMRFVILRNDNKYAQGMMQFRERERDGSRVTKKTNEKKKWMKCSKSTTKATVKLCGWY